MEKRLPVAGRPGKSPFCVPEYTISIANDLSSVTQALGSSLKSGLQ